MKAALMVPKFDVPGRLVTVQATGNGKVNDTYLAICRTTFSEERFVLQRLNPFVFPRPQLLMDNMQVVTEHVHQRLEAEEYMSDRIWQLPKMLPAADGNYLAKDGDGEYWRAISHIASATSYQTVQSLEHAYEAGFVLGQFQRLISDIPCENLHDTLRGFHVTPQYLEEFDNVLNDKDVQKCVHASVAAEECYEFVTKRRSWCSVLTDAYERGELTQQPIHGDPKVSNVMIDDATGKGTSIIDLDTVKPGLTHYDFGDCLRSCCNPAGEEADELDKVYFDMDLCRAIVSGYMHFAKHFLTEADHNYLYEAIRLLAFELGLRFFTDFLHGNKYFKTEYEEQNLNRARIQFKLCDSIEKKEKEIRNLLESV